MDKTQVSLEEACACVLALLIARGWPNSVVSAITNVTAGHLNYMVMIHLSGNSQGIAFQGKSIDEAFSNAVEAIESLPHAKNFVFSEPELSRLH
jgi:hypothetical protein